MHTITHFSENHGRSRETQEDGQGQELRGQGKANDAVGSSNNDETSSYVKMVARRVHASRVPPQGQRKARCKEKLDGEAPVHGQRPSGEAAVVTECTFKDCDAGGEMHADCFAKLEKTIMTGLCAIASNRGGAFSDLPEDEQRKAMFTTKWDLARPFCRCACGKGYMRPKLNGRAHVVRVGEEQALATDSGSLSQADLEKKAKHEAKLAAKAKAEAEAKQREKERAAKEREIAKQEKAQRKEERERLAKEGGGGGAASGSCGGHGGYGGYGSYGGYSHWGEEQHIGSGWNDDEGRQHQEQYGHGYDHDGSHGLQPPAYQPHLSSSYWQPAGFDDSGDPAFHFRLPPSPSARLAANTAAARPSAWGSSSTTSSSGAAHEPSSHTPCAPLLAQQKSFDLTREAAAFPGLANGGCSAINGGSGVGGVAGSDDGAGAGSGDGNGGNGDSSGASTRRLTNLRAEDYERCAICLEEPNTADVRLECSHCFCSRCLQGWAQEITSYAATARKGCSLVTCPVCRRPSTIAPSTAQRSRIASAATAGGVGGGARATSASAGSWPRVRPLPAVQARVRTILEMPYRRLHPSLGADEHVGWVAALIGKGGGHIGAIQQESGAQVLIQKSSIVPAGAKVRTIELIGTESQRRRAEQLIRARLSQLSESLPSPERRRSAGQPPPRGGRRWKSSPVTLATRSCSARARWRSARATRRRRPRSCCSRVSLRRPSTSRRTVVQE